MQDKTQSLKNFWIFIIFDSKIGLWVSKKKHKNFCFSASKNVQENFETKFSQNLKFVEMVKTKKKEKLFEFWFCEKIWWKSMTGKKLLYTTRTLLKNSKNLGAFIFFILNFCSWAREISHFWSNIKHKIQKIEKFPRKLHKNSYVMFEKFLERNLYEFSNFHRILKNKKSRKNKRFARKKVEFQKNFHGQRS